MPEQLTAHPEVTLKVLRSAGVSCGDGGAAQILTACPGGRLCRLPGGELCVYGLDEATQMTQIRAADWQRLAPPAEAGAAAWSGAALAIVALLALVAGVAVGWFAARWRRR